MKNLVKGAGVMLGLTLAAAGCTPSNSASDAYIDGDGPSRTLDAGVWTDPDGCDHWIADDGVEGYMSPRLNKDGTPVCRPEAVPGQITGNYRDLLFGRANN
ncbi:hypothetical protein [Oceanomicrobium pacificus]|uniref:Lipoprotein n=1 Tax=Oceanomicrobium pacificus TaxID=2692916 RepID=A0A6B0TRL1_9RHOB|nr:hypothetical protein [Oceanomicrobium pacificus]MXU64445.1 hypothetical protein [Oceanomicrobium pacificus]